MIDVLKTLYRDEILLMTVHTSVRHIVKRSIFDVCIHRAALSIGFEMLI